jgi:hypothetical protein
MTEIQLVQVGLQDIDFIVFRFDHQRAHRLGYFAAHGPFGAEITVLDQLLGDGAATLLDLAGFQICQCRPGDRACVDTGMREEAVVLCRQHCLPDPLGQQVQHHRNAIRTISAQRLGNYLGFEPQDSLAIE